MSAIRPVARTATLAVGLATLGFSLACSGLFGEEVKPNPDETDPAEIARLRHEFSVAESILTDRLDKDPSDHRSWRLLGDVHTTRGQVFRQRWKENLGWAFDAYSKAVALQPKECRYWARIATTVAASAANDATQVDPAAIRKLPMKAGWKNCPGGAMLELEYQAMPNEDAWVAAQKKAERGASELEIRLLAQPNLKDAYTQVPKEGWEWQTAPGRPSPKSGLPFVVLEGNVTASGVGGAKARKVKPPEIMRASSVTTKVVNFTDRKLPARTPKRGVVRASACPGSSWKIAGVDREPVGTCGTGPFNSRKSTIHDPARLKVAGPAHWSHPTIDKSVVDRFDIVDGSVKCLGGRVDKLFVDEATCHVSYDKGIYQTRAVPKDAGLAAWSEEHAERMVDAQNLSAVLGPEVAGKLAHGEYAIGMPYNLWTYTQPDLTGCKGRGVLNRVWFNGGQAEFTCELGDTAYTFVDMTLAKIGPVEKAQ